MADEKAEQAPGGKKDIAKPNYADWRLIPGGSLGARTDVGMSSIRREVVVTGGAKPAQLDMTDSPQGLEI